MGTLKLISGLIFWIGLMMIGIGGEGTSEFLKSLDNTYIFWISFISFILVVVHAQITYHTEMPETVKRCNSKIPNIF